MHQYVPGSLPAVIGNKGGQPRRRRAPIPHGAPSAGGCLYHTAIFAAFQLEVAESGLQVDSARSKVQTFLDSTVPLDYLATREFTPLFQAWKSFNNRRADLAAGFGESVSASQLAEEILKCTISSQ
jgi:hypothetical protein